MPIGANLANEQTPAADWNTHQPHFDLTGDGRVDVLDRDAWLVAAGQANLPSGNPYLLGDANLDGVVDVSDFNIWNSNKFTNQAIWCSGNFSADNAIDVSDFNIWNSNKFQSSAESVPEPTTSLHACLFLSLLRWMRVRWQIEDQHSNGLGA